MKKRFKNIITTCIGLVIWGVSIAMLWLGKIDIMAFGSLMGLGYVFVVAKDSLLEGLSLGFFKPKE